MNFYRRLWFTFLCCFIFTVYAWHILFINKLHKIEKSCTPLTKKKSNLINSLTSSSYIVSKADRLFLSLNDLVIATVATLDHIGEAIRSCDSFQQHPQLKNVPFKMYFIGKIPKDVLDLYVQFCPVANITFLDDRKYYFFLDDLNHFKFKALYQALALQKYKAVLSIDCSVRFPKRLDFNQLISEAVKRNPLDVTLLSSAEHVSYVVNHPDMYNCFPAINPIKMQTTEQFQSGLILWIGSKNGRKILKKFLECTLQQNCIAPPGAHRHCDYGKIYTDNTTFSGCHRFDQSALNLILYEESNYLPKLFQWNHSDFVIERSVKFIF